jgi:nitroimidazol reductase NimA-like FMN-containing flavoprotein (pyridoxamine 5'-phosphate oxidase superfamily)
MCFNDEPYLVTLSHGFDEGKNCIFFHCASEGKKIDFLQNNPVVWGQALIDNLYQQGSCDHLYQTTQFKGRVSFLDDYEEKMYALKVMINQLDDNPDEIIKNQLKPSSIEKTFIGRIDLYYLSGKKSDEIIISL